MEKKTPLIYETDAALDPSQACRPKALPKVDLIKRVGSRG